MKRACCKRHFGDAERYSRGPRKEPTGECGLKQIRRVSALAKRRATRALERLSAPAASLVKVDASDDFVNIVSTYMPTSRERAVTPRSSQVSGSST
jgi:hypothetical protein